MVFNATFNNILVISWRSVLLVEETTDLSQVTANFGYVDIPIGTKCAPLLVRFAVLLA
jgi:hypothetical protein